MESLGQEIAQRRTDLGKSQVWLAKQARCSRVTMSKIERGLIAHPQTEIMVAIAEALGLPENMYRTRGLDAAADALFVRRNSVVDAAGLLSVARTLTEGQPMCLKRVGDNRYAVELPDTDPDDRANDDAYAALGGVRRRAS